MNPDYVKLDKDFTAKAMSNAKDYKLLNKIVELVHSIDIKICIEGVEKKEWYQKLKKIHVDYLQGYLFGRPCEKNQFIKQFVFHAAGQENYNVITDDGKFFRQRGGLCEMLHAGGENYR